MKKYNWSWSISNLVQETQKEVVSLQNKWGIISAAIAGSTYAATNADFAFFTAIGCAVVNYFVLGGLCLTEIKETEVKQS